MAFSVDITAAASKIESNKETKELGQLLETMIMAAGNNAFDSLTEESQRDAVHSAHHIPEYEYYFAATLDGMQAADYAGANESKLTDLADEWLQAQFAVAKLNQ